MSVSTITSRLRHVGEHGLSSVSDGNFRKKYKSKKKIFFFRKIEYVSDGDCKRSP